MIEIKNRFDRSVLYTAENAQDVRAAVQEAARANADLSCADLRYADLRYANLRSADLRSADLRYANLRSADLSSADLSSADFRYANLSSADFRYAENVNFNRVDDLRILLDQPGMIRAYKIVTKDGYGPFNGGIQYKVGQSYEAKANTGESSQCGAGINLATLPWCLAAFYPGFRLLLCEFTKEDIACIPYATDGKFRVHKCKVVKELKPEDYGIDSDGRDTGDILVPAPEGA